jgi:hypothetical protein
MATEQKVRARIAAIAQSALLTLTAIQRFTHDALADHAIAADHGDLELPNQLKGNDESSTASASRFAASRLRIAVRWCHFVPATQMASFVVRTRPLASANRP